MSVETLLTQILAEMRGGKGPSKGGGLIDPKTGAPMPPSARAQAEAAAAAAAERVAAAEERAATSAEKSLHASERNLENIKDALAVTEKLRDAEEDTLKRQKLQVDYAQEALREAQEMFKIAQAEAIMDKDKKAASDAALANMTRARNEVAKQAKEYDRIAKSQQISKQAADDIANFLGPTVARARRLAKHFKEVEESAGAGAPIIGLLARELASMAGAIAPILPGLVAFTAGIALVAKFASTTKELVLSADELRSQFVAITGDTSAVRMAFVDLTMSNLDLAISFENAMGAQLALREGFDGFLLQSPAVKASLTLHAATMERLGVDTGTTAENLNVLTKTFGMSVTDAKAMQREMIGLATALELPVAVMMDRLTKTMPLLAEFGVGAIDVFRRLQSAARETGLSVDEITSTFGDALNSYEASTKVAGQLNQVLGAGVISGTELLMADTEERFQIVQDALELTGRSFSDLGRWEKISFAQAAGFDTVNAAARAFNNTQDDIATRIGDTAISQEQMNELVVEATDSMTQLKFVMLSFAVALKPAIETFAQYMDEFLEKSEAMEGGLAGRISRWVSGLGVVMGLITGIVALVTSPALLSAGGISLTLGAIMSGLTALTGWGLSHAASAATGGITPRSGPGKHVLVHPQEAIIPLNRPEGRAALAAAASGALDASTAAAIGAAVKEAVSPLIAAVTRAGGTGAVGSAIEFVLQADTRELGRFIKEGALDAAGGDAFAPV